MSATSKMDESRIFECCFVPNQVSELQACDDNDVPGLVIFRFTAGSTESNDLWTDFDFKKQNFKRILVDVDSYRLVPSVCYLLNNLIPVLPHLQEIVFKVPPIYEAYALHSITQCRSLKTLGWRGSIRTNWFGTMELDHLILTNTDMSKITALCSKRLTLRNVQSLGQFMKTGVRNRLERLDVIQNKKYMEPHVLRDVITEAPHTLSIEASPSAWTCNCWDAENVPYSRVVDLRLKYCIKTGDSPYLQSLVFEEDVHRLAKRCPFLTTMVFENLFVETTRPFEQYKVTVRVDRSKDVRCNVCHIEN